MGNEIRLDGAGFRMKLIGALALVYIVWGTTYYALDIVVRELPPLFANGSRFVVAGLVMLGIALFSGQALPRGRQWLWSVVIGALMVFGAMTLVTAAQAQGIGSGLVATVVATMPLWLAFWSRLGGERISVTAWAALGVGAAGAAVLALEGDFSATPMGAVFAFAAPVCWSLGSWLSRRVSLPAPAMTSAMQWLAGGLLSLMVSAPFEPWPVLTALSPAAWGAWLYLVVLGTLVALNAYLWLLKHAPAPVAGSYTFVNPAVALAVGAGLGREVFTGWVFVAMPMILLALALLLYGNAILAGVRQSAARVSSWVLNLRSSS